MTQLLHQAIEEALKQPADVQDAIASAMLGQISKARKHARPIGLADGKVHVHDDFNDPLPDDELAFWNGEGPDEHL